FVPESHTGTEAIPVDKLGCTEAPAAFRLHLVHVEHTVACRHPEHVAADVRDGTGWRLRAEAGPGIGAPYLKPPPREVRVCAGTRPQRSYPRINRRGGQRPVDTLISRVDLGCERDLRLILGS